MTNVILSKFYELAISAGLNKNQASKYVSYVKRKQDGIDREERIRGRDSERQRVYDCEARWEQTIWKNFLKDYDDRKTGADAFSESYRFKSIELCQQYVDKVLKSKTWKKLDENKTTYGVTLKLLKRNSQYSGMAHILDDMIKLNPRHGFNKFVILHELSHIVHTGCYTHGIKFRQRYVALVRRFLGRSIGDALYKEYRADGLKMKINYKIKTPREWLKVSTPVMNRMKLKVAAKR